MRVAVPSLAFVVAAGPAVGLGHLARSAVLARVLSARGHRVRLHVVGSVPERCSMADVFEVASAEPDVPKRVDADIAVVDVGTDVTAPEGPRLRCAVSDGPPGPLWADLIIDPNLTASEASYIDTSTRRARTLAGPGVALVAPEFVTARARRADRHFMGSKLLVTSGGADPVGVSALVLTAIEQCEGSIEAKFLLGPFHGDLESLRTRIEGAGHVAVVGEPLHAHVDDAALAVSTLGVTAAELACAGVPNLAIAISPLHHRHLREFVEAGLVADGGTAQQFEPARLRMQIGRLLSDPDASARLAARARAVVDGRGAERAASAILQRWESVP